MSGHFPSDVYDEAFNFFHGPVYKFYMIIELFFNAYRVTYILERVGKRDQAEFGYGGRGHAFIFMKNIAYFLKKISSPFRNSASLFYPVSNEHFDHCDRVLF